ncbi:MAG: phosphoglycerate kinase [Oscillospiraceae bacterium]|nr:phosphoglycerate kinase [Oscillospiraceae bacterium]
MGKSNKKNVNDLNVKGRRILVRCDFNVPVKDGAITNDKRIQAALPTIKKLMEGGGKVILCSHLGKPKNGPEDKFSLGLVGERLSELLGKNVVFAKDDTVVGDNAKAAISAMNDGDVVLLENTRFRAEETKNGEAFSRELAEICDDYVNDAFGSAHRAHCSTAGVTDFVKGQTAVGYLMEKEIEFLGNAVENPERPFVAILGGAKVADKLNVISNLLEKCDTLIIGGGMAYTFMKAKGFEIGHSLVDDDKLGYCTEMLEKAESLGKKLLLPTDNVVAKDFPNPIDAPIETKTVCADCIPADYMGLDIGEETRKLFGEAVKSAKTVVWNGPMGVFENPQLAAGTLELAKVVAEADAVTVIGGGDSVAAVTQLGFADKMSHISTGGGASLEYLEGKVLPGIRVIQDKE